LVVSFGRLGSALRGGWRHRRTLAIIASMLEPGWGYSLGWNLRRAITPADARRAAACLLRGQPVLLEIEHDGVRWTIDVGDTIGEELFGDGSFHREEVRAVLNWLGERSGIVVDAGANIGPTSIEFARSGRDVVAIEPVPSTFELLEKNVIQNHLEGKIRCLQRAISTSTEVTMWLTSASGQNEVMVAGQQPGFHQFGVTERLPIQVVGAGLAEILEMCDCQPEDVALVWSDTQGCETAVVLTGLPLWAAGVPLWTEVWPNGLELHGGAGAFVGAVEQHFSGFIPRASLLARPAGAPRSTTTFRAWFDRVGNETDVLLIP
jgi:FkbM family methyltransferase